MSHVTLSIIVGTYNRLALLKKCLEALGKGVRVDREIIVVDAGSTDGTLEYLQQCPTIRLVRDEGLIGQAKSLNRVFAMLNSDFVCWLSDDNIILDGALDSAVDILQHHSSIGMVALKVKDITGAYTRAPYLGGIWETGILNCNQGMLPTRLLRQLGGFDEKFRDYGIDADLTTRVLLAGYQVVYTKRVAIHHYRDHETDNWITKSNREQRLQSARDLYRSRYAPLLIPQKTFSSVENSNFKKFVSKFLLYLKGKVVKHYKILARHLKFSLDESIVNHWLGPFFRDWYNVSHGRFISRWDLFLNLHRPYYLVQQIPDSLRLQFWTAQNSNLRNG